LCILTGSARDQGIRQGGFRDPVLEHKRAEGVEIGVRVLG
jgi:hypothetical protein